MAISEHTMRKMAEELFGQDLSHEELDELMRYARRQLETSRNLQELDLGSEDPQGMHYIIDRRLAW